jgi:hypothetical protein
MSMPEPSLSSLVPAGVAVVVEAVVVEAVVVEAVVVEAGVIGDRAETRLANNGWRELVIRPSWKWKC